METGSTAEFKYTSEFKGGTPCTHCSEVIPEGFLRIVRTEYDTDGSAFKEEFYHPRADCLRRRFNEVSAYLGGTACSSLQDLCSILNSPAEATADAAAATEAASALVSLGGTP